MYLQATFAAFNMQHSKHQRGLNKRKNGMSDRELNSDVLFRMRKDTSSLITVGPQWMKINSTDKIDNFSLFHV